MKYWDQWIVGFLPVDLLLQQVSHLYNQLRLTRMMLIRRKMKRMREEDEDDKDKEDDENDEDGKDKVDDEDEFLFSPQLGSPLACTRKTLAPSFQNENQNKNRSEKLCFIQSCQSLTSLSLSLSLSASWSRSLSLSVSLSASLSLSLSLCLDLCPPLLTFLL